jgi:hypothetical protein
VNELLNPTLILGMRVEEEIAKGGRILVERNGEIHELALPRLPDATEAIRPPLRASPLRPFPNKIEVLDGSRAEDQISRDRE